MASCNDSTSAISVSGWHPQRQATYVYPESMGGGAGAFADRDGMDAVHVHTVNSTNLPAEALELEYPLLLEEYCPRAGFRRRRPAPRRHGHGAPDPHPRGRHDLLRALGCACRSRRPACYGGLPSNVTRILRNPGHRPRGGPALQGLGPGARRPARRSASRRSAAAATAIPPSATVRSLAADLRQGKVSRAAAERDYGPRRTSLGR